MIVAQTKIEAGAGTEDRGLGGKKKQQMNTVPGLGPGCKEEEGP